MLFSRHLFPLALALALASTAAGQSLETLRTEADRTAALALKAAEATALARQNLADIKAEYGAAVDDVQECYHKLYAAQDNGDVDEVNRLQPICTDGENKVDFLWTQSDMANNNVQVAEKNQSLLEKQAAEAKKAYEDAKRNATTEATTTTAEATTTSTEPTTTATEPTTTATEPTTTSTEPTTTTQTTMATDPTDSTTTAQTAVVTDPSYTLGHIFAQLRQIVFGLLSNFLQWISSVVKYMEVLAEKAFDNLNTSNNAAL